MTDATLLPFDLSAVRRKKLTADFGGGNQFSNGGLLLLRNAERKLGVCGRLADAMPDRREASRIRHAMFDMVMARVCAIACGHEDAIDLDRLRHDPLMKVCRPLSHRRVLADARRPRHDPAYQPARQLLRALRRVPRAEQSEREASPTAANHSIARA
jgi:hypothetical protein